MSNPFYELTGNIEIEEPKKSSSKDNNPFFKISENVEESQGKSWFRDLYQIPSGILKRITYPMDLISLMGQAASTDPEEIEQIRRISEREGIPFDEEAYMQAVQNAASTFPTQSNIERGIEETTGAPLTPQTGIQHFVNAASTGGAFTPGSLQQKVAGGTIAAGSSEAMQAAGLPREIADPIGLGLGAYGGSKSPNIKAATKESGLPKRQFENLKKPRKVPAKKYESISKTVENDVKNIYEDIAKESPIAKTKGLMEENPAFKSEVSESFEKVERLAEEIPDVFESKMFKKDWKEKSSETKGLSLSEYEKEVGKFRNQFLKDIKVKKFTPADLVSQFRKNNKALTEAYDPSKPYAFNRAKKDALHEYNSEIANFFEEMYPDSEFSNLFKETNKQWSQISDVEAMNGFIDSVFDGKIDYTQAKKIFKNSKQAAPFKRALGDKYSQFEQLMKDFIETETAFKKLKIAEKKGFEDLSKKAIPYLISPKLGTATTVVDASRLVTNKIINSFLEKPKLKLEWNKGVKAIEKGKFAEAEKIFNDLDKKID